MSDAAAETDDGESGTAEAQGPVQVTQRLDEALAEKREDLFEEFGIADGFPPEVLAEAKERTQGVDDEIEEAIDDREDLRELTTWTTDPIDAQDFDDAISVRDDGDEYHLWVHIADVTHYVHP